MLNLMIWLKNLKEVLRSYGVPKTSPTKVIEAVLRRGVNWYDFEKLDLQKQVTYYNDIQLVLQNQAYMNEVNHFLADLIEEVAKSDSEHNRDKMLRYSINGIQVLHERLGDIQDPRAKEPTKDTIHDVV
jgi:hypothetical protein